MQEGDKEQDNLQRSEIGLIKITQIDKEMESAYLDYAMSVIVSRALPDVRDGLKPVHRRILYAMHQLGLTSGAKFRKSAAITGETLAKFHPHGDVAVYDALVRMAQDFTMRYPLIKGQGNFGSIDNDPPAAQRYTEAKMTAIAEELLLDIEKETIPFMDNYDGTTKEPVVLPSRLPALLLNGSMGIAVGMATNIPPHNLKEVIDAAIYLIDKPDATTEDLFQFVKGPDFPTGGIIYDIKEIKEAYSTGKGRIAMRGKAEIIKSQDGKKTQIIITEIPYGVNKADLVQKIAELVKNKKIEGVADLRDESDREGIRIVLDLKKDAFAQKILNSLFKYTQLQETFHLNMLALVDGLVPRILNLKMVLEEWLKHRQLVTQRRCEYELRQAEERAHILEGLKKALENLDAVIQTIRSAETREKARLDLINKFDLDEPQAEAILEMRLSALAGLERKKVLEELKQKLSIIARLKEILSDRAKILSVIKEELVYLKNKYGDERRTKVVATAVDQLTDADLIPNEEVIVTVTSSDYAKRTPLLLYRSQSRGGKGVTGMELTDNDGVNHLLSAHNLDDIFFFTNLGRVYRTKVYEIPVAGRAAKGIALVNLVGLRPQERVTSIITVEGIEHKSSGSFLFMVTKKGIIKKSPLIDYKNVRKNGLITISLPSDDELCWVKISSGSDQVVILTKNGFAIRFSEQNVRPLSRAARGVIGIRLSESDEVIGADIVRSDDEILTVTANGLGKRTPLKHFKVQQRGGKGLIAHKITAKTGQVVAACIVDKEVKDVILVSKLGQVIRIPYRKISLLGRATQGVRLMRLNQGDLVSSVTYTRRREEKEK